MNPGRTSGLSVVSLWRYPVKSMLGEELTASYITERGLLGDRAFALIDEETGKVASAKNPSKWGKLFDFRATYAHSPRPEEEIPDVRITLPGGAITSSDPEIDPVLSNALGRNVKIMKASPEHVALEEYWPDLDGLAHRETLTDESMRPKSFFDSGAVHLLTTSTLNKLRKHHPEGRFEVPRFRPNVVIDSAGWENEFIEDAWVGRTLSVGDEVQFRVDGSCSRCVMTTLPQGDLPRDLGILRTAAKLNHVNVGVYASVLRSGNVRRGDEVRFES